ncbi:MAG TPA: response regulator transcription factor [Acidimicrobiales bacterium]|jgi:two-component system NarL family response regulator
MKPTSRQSDAVIEVIVVDDDEGFRQVVTAVLAAEPDIVVVGEACDGDQAVTLAAEYVPTVVLMDVRMPGTGGIDAVRAIKERMPTTKVIMLTASDEEEDLFKALRAGASGYVLKDSNIAEIDNSIRAVVSGQSVLSPPMAAKLVVEFSGPAASEALPESVCLTDRELEILGLIADGHANPEIAKRLYLSTNTVKRHVANILAKLHQRSRLGAVLYAQRRDLLE